MKFRFLMSAMLATAFCVAPAWAKTVKPSNYSITPTILLTGCTTPHSGPCTGGSVGWADVCPSRDCFCCTYTGTARGAAGNGPVTLYATNDYGDGGVGFDPAYGEIDIDGSKDVEGIVFTGVDLVPVDNVNDSTAENFLNGGCIIWDSKVFTEGFARCGGNYSKTTSTKFYD